MNLNPLALLDSVLTDWTSARVRRLIHAIVLLLLFLAGLWLTAQGNWKEALGALVAAGYAASNHSNTPIEPLPTIVSGNLPEPIEDWSDNNDGFDAEPDSDTLD